MSLRLFHDLGTTSWTRVSVIVAAATASWAILGEIVPVHYHAIGAKILAAITVFIAVLLKSGDSPKQEVKEAIQAVKDKAEEEKKQP